MKRKRHPSEKAKVIVFLDANMPSVRDCSYGCASDADRMCRHRFGPRIWICDRPRDAVRPGSPEGTRETPFNRFKDLDVVRWWINQIRRRWADKKGQVRQKRFVLATHDVDFLADVQKQYVPQYVYGSNSPEFPLTFGSTWAQSGDGKQAVRLEVLTLQGGLSRDHDLRTVVTHCRQLRKKEPPRPQ